MIKVMIADDEILVRIGMKSIIPWEKYGFEIIGEASDGLEVLSLCEKQMPDIILTDIKMPNMDGMELIKAVKRKYKEIYCIILTCMDEMQYVKEAMALGASGYFTKISINKDEMLELLLRLKDEVELYRIRESEIETLKKYLVDNRLVLRENFISDLQNADDASIDTIIEKCPLPLVRSCLNSNTLIVVIIKGPEARDEAALKQSAFNLLEEIMKNEMEQGEVFPVKGLDFIITGHIDLSCLEKNKNKIYSIMNRIKENLSTYLNLNEVVIVDSVIDSIRQIPYEYNRIQKLSINKSIDKTSGRIMQDYDNVYFKYEPVLISAVCDGDAKVIVDTVKILLEKALEYGLGLERTKKVALQILYIYEKEVRAFGESIDNLFSSDIVGSVFALSSMDKLREEIINFSMKIGEVLAQSKENSYREDIRKVIDFIELYYKEKLTLDYAASIVNMNSAYFSRLFKKETGVGFIEYLTSYRVNKSKEHLRNKALKLIDIAQGVGYDDENYFSKTFKKYTGISPSQYRYKIK